MAGGGGPLGGVYLGAYSSPFPYALVPIPPAPTYDTPSSPCVSVRTPYLPFPTIAILSTASAVHRSYESMKTGKATFSVSRADPAIAANPDILRRGSIVTINSSPGQMFLPPWAGPIVQITASPDGGTLQIDCQDMSALIDSRLTRQHSAYTLSVGQIFLQLMLAANGRSHTGVFVQPGLVSPGPSVEVDLASNSVLRAFDSLYQKSGYEWWIDVSTTSARVDAVINFGYRQGLDRARGEVTVYEDVHCALEYVLDTTGLQQAMTVYGGTGPASARAAVTRTSRYLPQGGDLGTYLDPASEAYIRAADIPPSLRTETAIFDLTSSNRTQLGQDVGRAMERGIGSSERFRLILNTVLPWSEFAVGNYIQVISTETGLGTISRKVRVTGLQPDEDRGELVAVVETPLN